MDQMNKAKFLFLKKHQPKIKPETLKFCHILLSSYEYEILYRHRYYKK